MVWPGAWVWVDPLYRVPGKRHHVSHPLYCGCLFGLVRHPGRGLAWGGGGGGNALPASHTLVS